MIITQESKLSDIVNGNLKTAAIFEYYGLDYYSGGSNSLGSACTEKNISADEVIRKLNNANFENGNENFNELSLNKLIDYIVNEHHSYVTKMLTGIGTNCERVLKVHGKNHSELEEVFNIWTELSDELRNHLMKEERMLFPYIKNLVKTKRESISIPYAPFGAVSNPIKVMEKEHTITLESFIKLRKITNNFMLPSDACAVYEVLFDELKDFEKDLHIHIYLENNILHPKAISLENELIKET